MDHVLMFELEYNFKYLILTLQNQKLADEK